MKKYTKESIIESIQRFYEINKRIPLSIDFRKNPDYPSDKTVYNHFGSFGQAIIAAGFVDDKYWSQDTIILAIKKFYSIHNTKPRNRDFKDNTDYPSCDTIVNHFGSFNEAIKAAGLVPNKTPSNTFTNFSKKGIVLAIQEFYIINNRIPSTRDFMNNSRYPSNSIVKNTFGSWNNAIEAAGFIPNIQNGYGINTYGLDKHLYRSRAEAYFADKYLYNLYNYDIETPYPATYNKYYDWYIPSLDLYIELDGGCRPEITKDKIEINKILTRNCLFISTSDIYNKTALKDFI